MQLVKLLTVAFFLSFAFLASAAQAPGCIAKCPLGSEEHFGCLKKAKQGTRVEVWSCDKFDCSRDQVLYDITSGSIQNAKSQFFNWCQNQ